MKRERHPSPDREKGRGEGSPAFLAPDHGPAPQRGARFPAALAGRNRGMARSGRKTSRQHLRVVAAPAPAPSSAGPVPAPEEPSNDVLDGIAEITDRAVHAAMARMTGGLSPAALAGAYVDWAVHLAFAPGKQMQLAGKARAQGDAARPLRRHAARPAARCRALHRAAAGQDRRFDGAGLADACPTTSSTRASCCSSNGGTTPPPACAA